MGSNNDYFAIFGPSTGHPGPAMCDPPCRTNSTQKSTTGLRREVWIIPLLSIAALNVFIIICFEFFVLFKTSKTTPNRRHVFLGQMLLLGLFLSSILSVAYTLEPTVVSCAVTRIGLGVAYAIVFSTLLVKCVFLISLNTGVYLPANYQALLLFFAVLIQVVIGVQWLVTRPPFIQDGLCAVPFQEHLLALLYVIFLVGMVTLLAIKSRTIRDNYREAIYIGVAVGASIPLWIGWILAGLVLEKKYHDACVAVGLAANSLLVFLVMFMPKGRQLAAMGKEGLYSEDREERVSIEYDPSRYSPSFYHFRPVKVVSQPHRQMRPQHPPPPPDSNYKKLFAPVPASSYGNPGFYYPYTFVIPRCTGYTKQPDDTNHYSSIDQKQDRTLSSNPNVFFFRSSTHHPGMMY